MQMTTRSIALSLLAATTLALTACGQAAAPNAAAVPKAAEASKDEHKDDHAKGFTEYPIGDDQEAAGLTVALVYFQPVPMVPESKAGVKPADADMHLEADIAAGEKNPIGFGVGEFVPYLQVSYSIKNTGTGETREGNFMPMNAADGSHYGANVKMPGGAGTYKVTVKVKAPDDFLLHTDKETGVDGRWWSSPQELSWDFKYIPRKW